MGARRTFVHFLVVAAFSFAGGFSAALLGGGAPATAQQASSGFFALNDGKNLKGVNLYVHDGQPGQIFYGENGQMRVQIGTYSGTGERGQPLFALSDVRGHIRLLLRLAGPNESPVLVMKDKAGRDRLVMGLALSGEGQEPFLSITGADGKRHDVFGSFTPPGGGN